MTVNPNPGCSTYACGAAPDCVLESTTTLYVPTQDPCCPTTPTTTIQGPCPTCQKGCLTVVETATVTTAEGAGTTSDSVGVIATPPVVTPTLVKRDTSTITSAPCTSTMIYAKPWELGPTRTEYAWTITETVYRDCGGCDSLVVKDLEGIGPVV